MGKDHYFPFEYEKFLAATQLWTDEEVGIYVRFLMAQWQEKKLPKSKKKLSNLVTATAHRLRKLWPTIGSKFIECPDDHECIFNVKLEDVRIKVSSTRKALSDAGKRGARKRWHPEKKDGKANRVAINHGHGNQNQSQIDFDLSIDKSDPGGSDHFSKKVGEYLSNIEDLCRTIDGLPKKSKFNPWAWVQSWANKGGHPRAIKESLDGLIGYWDTVINPWAYADVAMKTKSQNYHESDHVKESNRFKDLWDADPKVRNLAVAIFR